MLAVLSFTLHDADDKLLLSASDITLGDTPQPIEAPPSNPSASSRRLLGFTDRRLLKGGTAHGHVVTGHRVTHASVAKPWGTTTMRPVPTSYGLSGRRAVMAGTLVVLMHHGHGGYGRYYDNPSCGSYERGCEMVVPETLSRDAFAGYFTITPELAFPLKLRITRCEVTRALDGPPSVFFTLYSPTGGPPEKTWVDGALAWLFVPLLLGCFCLQRAILAGSGPADWDHEP